MAQQINLSELFGSIAQEMQTDRHYLNGLDSRNRNAGDNMAKNFQIISDALAQQQGKVDDRDALTQAAEVLREQGQGKTASLYANGLEQAALSLPTGSLSMDDILPLLEGLLRGVQQASGARQGQGTLLDALIPGVLGYMQAKQQGASDMEAILDALSAARRGTNGGYYGQDGNSLPFPMPGQTQQPGANSPYGGGQTQQPGIPQIDPGAAGVGSLLEGLFRGILKGGLGGALGGGLGGLLGGSDQNSSSSYPPASDSDQNTGSIGSHRRK